MLLNPYAKNNEKNNTILFERERRKFSFHPVLGNEQNKMYKNTSNQLLI